MRTILSRALAELNAHRSVVLVTIVAEQGSAPRGPGSQMLVGADGQLTGTIGGGQVERQSELLALSLLKDAHEAEDAVQDTFLKFLEKAPAELDSPPAWLMRVLVNGCRDRLRAAWRRRSVPLWESLPAPEPEERQELEEIFSLPPADRAVIHLFYYEGLSTGEIARLTGQAEGTVRSRLSRARSRLRRLLEGETK